MSGLVLPTDDAPAAKPRDSRLSGLIVVGALAASMWVAEVLDRLDHGHLEAYGIRPRSESGLWGILTAPFLHVGYQHLLANTVPFLVCGALLALSGALRVLAVTAIVVVLGGLGTWLIAPAHTDTVGASGLVFGYIAYLIARGLFSRRPLHLLLGVAVLALYGSTILFGLEPHAGISWQGHLAGGLAGLAAAALLERRQKRAVPALPVL